LYHARDRTGCLRPLTACDRASRLAHAAHDLPTNCTGLSRYTRHRPTNGKARNDRRGGVDGILFLGKIEDLIQGLKFIGLIGQHTSQETGDTADRLCLREWNGARDGGHSPGDPPDNRRRTPRDPDGATGDPAQPAQKLIGILFLQGIRHCVFHGLQRVHLLIGILLAEILHLLKSLLESLLKSIEFLFQGIELLKFISITHPGRPFGRLIKQVIHHFTFKCIAHGVLLFSGLR
jgi:hypothetical protein